MLSLIDINKRDTVTYVSDISNNFVTKDELKKIAEKVARNEKIAQRQNRLRRRGFR